MIIIIIIKKKHNIPEMFNFSTFLWVARYFYITPTTATLVESLKLKKNTWQISDNKQNQR